MSREWLSRLVDSELVVFISSPGDCAVEREKCVDIGKRVSASDEAKAARLHLRIVRWEDLPPGEAEPGDLQSRITRVMKQHGLDRYDIYLGFMHNRVGTPTPTAESGTVQELEEARQGHRKRHRPAEVLFYFLTGEGVEENADVKALMTRLGDDGLLYSRMARADFEQVVEAHLRKVVAEWNQLLNRLERLLGQAPAIMTVTAVALLAVMGTVYWMLDRGGARDVAAHIEGPPQELMQAWAEAKPYLFIHRTPTRNAVNEALARRVVAADDLGAALALWAMWRKEGVGTGSPELERARAELLKRVDAALDAALLVVAHHRAREVFDQAWAAELWEHDLARAHERLAQMAAREAFVAIHTETSGLVDWDEQGLTPAEQAVLRDYAQRIIAQGEAATSWGSARLRHSVAVLGDDWGFFGRLATEAWSSSDEEELATLTHFVREGPPDVVAAWLGERDAPWSLSVAAAIERGLEHRDEKDLWPPFWAYLSLAVKQAPADEGGLFSQPRTLLSRVEEDAGASERLKEVVVRWTTDGTLPPVRLLEPALDALRETRLPTVAQEVITAHLLRLGDKGIDGTPLGYLARFDVPQARRYVRNELRSHESGSSSFGLSDKASLMRALVHGDFKEPDRRALRLVERARRDADLAGSSLNNLALVFAGYLGVVAKRGMDRWDQHRAEVEQIIDDRLRGARRNPRSILLSGLSATTDSFALTDPRVEYALGDVLDALPEDARRALLGFPPYGHPVIPEGFRDRVALLLPVLDEAWSLELADHLTKALLAFRVRDVATLRHAIKLSPAPVRAAFADGLLTLDADRHAEVVVGVDDDAWIAARILGLDDKAALEPLLERAHGDHLQHVLGRWVELGAAAEDVVGRALVAGYRHDMLVAAAEKALAAGGADVSTLGYALRYSKNGDRIASSLETMKPALERLDETEWLYWSAQVAEPHGGLAAWGGLAEVMTWRNVVWAESLGERREPAFVFGNRKVWSPLHESLVGERPAAVAAWARELIRSASMGTVQVAGELGAAEIAFRGYALWLWGRAAEAKGSAVEVPKRVPDTAGFAMDRPESGFWRAIALMAKAASAR